MSNNKVNPIAANHKKILISKRGEAVAVTLIPEKITRKVAKFKMSSGTGKISDQIGVEIKITNPDNKAQWSYSISSSFIFM
jgi:hypothetical protein